MMKHSNFSIIAIVTVFMVCTVTTTLAQEGAGLQVAEGNLCTNVVDRVCFNASTRFASPVERLFCFTKITGAMDPTFVTHVWYFGDTERARVRLSVNGATWRTWSSKIIQSYEIGDWRVEILGPDDQLLMAIPFEIF